jgi:hypothetical protein
MAIRETSDGTRVVERWTNEGTAGYYGGTPLARQRALTAQEAADLAAVDTMVAQSTTSTTISDYLTQRRARLTAIRTQAQAVSAKAQYATGQTATQLTTTVRDLQTDLKTLAAAIDDLAQYDIRLGRALLGQFDGTD